MKEYRITVPGHYSDGRPVPPNNRQGYYRPTDPSVDRTVEEVLELMHGSDYFNGEEEFDVQIGTRGCDWKKVPAIRYRLMPRRWEPVK